MTTERPPFGRCPRGAPATGSQSPTEADGAGLTEGEETLRIPSLSAPCAAVRRRMRHTRGWRHRTAARQERLRRKANLASAGGGGPVGPQTRATRHRLLDGSRVQHTISRRVRKKNASANGKKDDIWRSTFHSCMLVWQGVSMTGRPGGGSEGQDPPGRLERPRWRSARSQVLQNRGSLRGVAPWMGAGRVRGAGTGKGVGGAGRAGGGRGHGRRGWQEQGCMWKEGCRRWGRWAGRHEGVFHVVGASFGNNLLSVFMGDGRMRA